MTVCGLVRLDGAPVRRSILTAMLASSSVGLPSARGVHIDGPFGVMTATAFSGDPTPPIAVYAEKLVVVLDGCLGLPRWSSDSPVPFRGAAPAGGSAETAAGARGDEPAALAGAGSTDACMLAVAYRMHRERCLGPLGGDWIALIWESDRRRLVCARTGNPAQELLRWSDGRTFAFGTEPAQLRAAMMGHPRPGSRLGRIRCLGPDERLAVCLPTAPAGYPAMPAGAPYPSGCGAPADAGDPSVF
ncbi:hypothetical protein [Protofrankia symbiont of Coriaria ruscifolia]|uniref:hypothetical protein n=1 Tax=Protofrankia symbiont of Coriaria ruscifolia TaxID=1306542 RepID=UPI00104146C5|nr:hypothetical protein [Protofrankia symbiont of Coriaria ruscifolia]